MGIEVILATEFVSKSTAVHEPGTGTWRPVVLLEVTGRYNRTSMPAHVVIAIHGTEAAIEIGEGIILSAKRATLDAAVGLIDEDGAA